jgi:hypothetical protein
METKTYKTLKEFFKFLNDYEGEIWIRGSKAFDANGELVAEYNPITCNRKSIGNVANFEKQMFNLKTNLI